MSSDSLMSVLCLNGCMQIMYAKYYEL